MDDMDEDEALLAQAIAMSMQSEKIQAQVQSQSQTPTQTQTQTSQQTIGDTDMLDVNEEDEMELALQMSIQESPKGEKSQSENQDLNKAMEDANFVNSVLASLPGVDPNDERIKNALASIGKQKPEDKDKEKK